MHNIEYNSSSHFFKFIRFCCVGYSRIVICGNGACDVLPCHAEPRTQKRAATRVKGTLYLGLQFLRACCSGTRIPTVEVIGGSTKTSKMLLNPESMS